MLKTKRKMFSLAAVALLLAAAIAAIAFASPVRARTAAAENAAQDGGYWYSTESPYEVEFGDRLYRLALDHKKKDATNDAVSAEQVDAQCYTDMIELKDLDVEGDTNKWKRIYDSPANDVHLVAPHFNEIKLTFSFKFAEGSKDWFYIANGIANGSEEKFQDVGSDKWQYMLHIAKDGTVAFGCGLADGEDYTTDGLQNTKFATIGNKTAFTSDKVYQAEYTVQRLFGSEADVSGGTATGMRQSVKITSREVEGTDIEFAHNFTEGVTYCETSHKLRIGMQDDGTGISLASYYYSEDYAPQGEVAALDMDDAIPTLGPDGISSYNTGGYTIDGTQFTALQKVATTVSDNLHLMKSDRALLFRLTDFGTRGIVMTDIASTARAVQINNGTGGVVFVFSVANDRDDGTTKAWQENITAATLFNNGNNTRPDNLIVKLLYSEYESQALGRKFTKFEFALYDGSSITQQSDLEPATPWIRRTAFYPDSVTLGNHFTMRSGAGSSSAVGNNMTVSAVEFNREYDVTLKANDDDTEATTTTVKYGEAYNFDAPDQNKWPDYETFSGYNGENGIFFAADALSGTWNKENDNFNKVTYDAHYNKTAHKYEIALTAGYTPITYTVKFNPNGATMPAGKEGDITLRKDGTAYFLEDYTPTTSGSDKFFGWYTDETYADDKKVEVLTLDALVPTDKHHEAYTINLYAKIATGVTVTLEYPDGSSETKSAFAEDEFTFPTSFPEGKGNGYGAITGWQKKNGDGYDAAITGSITPTEDVTYKAVAAPITYTITYNTDGGNNDSQNPANYTVTSGDITFKAAEKAGYFFDGWYDSGGRRIDGIQTGTRFENLTLTARYVKNILPQSAETVVGTSYSLPPLATPANSSYTVAVKKDGSDTVLYDNADENYRYTFEEVGTYKIEYVITCPLATYTHTVTVTVTAKPVITLSEAYNNSYTSGTELKILSATCTGGGAVSYSVTKDGVVVAGGTVSGDMDDKLTLETGTYTVTYSADGAENVTYTFTVTAPAQKRGCGGCNSASVPLVGTLIALVGSTLFIKKH